MLSRNENPCLANETEHTSCLDDHKESILADEDSGPPKHQSRRRQPADAKKICQICGDKAFSVNFNVLTCESCKAFFRRNALKNKEPRCQSSGNCDISIQTRRTCKKCRLKKCFQAGMVKEWIMSDEARHRKWQLVQQNREKRKRKAVLDDQLGDSGSKESRSDELDFRSMTCAAPLISHWQSSIHSTLLPNTSATSYFTFQNSQTTMNPQSTNPDLTCLKLPTKPACVEDRQIGDESIRVPASLLTTLINQGMCGTQKCHHTHPNDGEWSVDRPSVIVVNKSAPHKCSCPCLCGATCSWTQSGLPIPHSPDSGDDTTSCESDCYLDVDDSGSTSSCREGKF